MRGGSAIVGSVDAGKHVPWHGGQQDGMASSAFRQVMLEAHANTQACNAENGIVGFGEATYCPDLFLNKP
jgi:hypothetical protein